MIHGNNCLSLKRSNNIYYLCFGKINYCRQMETRKNQVFITKLTFRLNHSELIFLCNNGMSFTKMRPLHQYDFNITLNF